MRVSRDAHPDNPACRRHEELAPLIELCKAGRLFDVQDWIAQGKPINPPPMADTWGYLRTPLMTALDLGFHSLVQVLLEGGAAQEPFGMFSPMNRALEARRFDMVQLFIAYGFDPSCVDMDAVFATWDRRIMEYFIDRGADIKQDNPFANAFCERIRTALGVYLRCREHDPDLQEQANIALRHHCKEGNMKWVSLMLWAGADPIVLHATTSRYFESQLHRHIPERDDCILCRIPASIVDARLECATGELEQEGQRSDAALPFLSATSALMLLSAMYRLAHGELEREEANWSRIVFCNPKRLAMIGTHRCSVSCPGIVPARARRIVHAENRWSHLDLKAACSNGVT